MTTDRPAAPRSTALAERSSTGSRTQAPPPEAFAALLGAQAPAEPKRQVAAPGPDARREDASTPGGAAAPDRPGVATDAAAPGAGDQAPAAVALLSDSTPATPEQLAAQLACPLPAAPQPAPPAAPQPAVTVPVGVVAAPVAQPAAPVQAAPAPAAPTAAAITTAATPTAAADAAPASAALAAATPAATGDAELPQPPAAPVGGAKAQPDTGDGKPFQPHAEQSASAPAPTPSTAPTAPAPAAPVATAAPPADAPVAPAADTISQPVQAAAPAAPAPTTTALQRAVPLYRAPHVAAAVIHLAQERGVTHARINLKPAELGGIEVRLHSTPQGISAHLIADSPEAARALSQASDDLRRQLEARDVTLLSLDVSTSGDDRRETGFGGDATAGDGSTGGHGGRSAARGESDQLAQTPLETTLVLPDGVLVDVLA
jgi:flagellar hook-length control protein FliK